MAKILLIDDDLEYRKILKIYLEKEGHLVTESENGLKGIMLFSVNNYDLVISDLFMPNVDGIHTIYRLMEEFNSPKIIAMTGSSTEGKTDILNLARYCGARDVYRKSENINNLLQKVRKIIVSN